MQLTWPRSEQDLDSGKCNVHMLGMWCKVGFYTIYYCTLGYDPLWALGKYPQQKGWVAMVLF
jgi:hypothetical protein